MDAILAALANTVTPEALLVLILGTIAGIVVGALPGLSSTMGVALCIPITFAMPADLSLVLLGAVYVSSVYGGSITAILLRTPGTDAAIATAFDGYPLAAQGRGGEAIGMATLGSLFGGLISAFALLFMAPPLSRVALAFGPQEYTMLAIFGLVTIIGVASEAPLKGLITATVGLLLATVGFDTFTGAQRFTFGQFSLYEGVPLLPALIGLFSVSQAIELCVSKGGGVLQGEQALTRRMRVFPLRQDLKRCFATMCRASGIGVVIGILPGAGTSIAAFIAYNDARRRSKTPERFGKGEIEGVAAAETANNAVTGGTLIPTLTLGIPGNAVTAVFIGGLTIHGLVPGPRLFTENAETTYTLMFSLFLANILFAVVGLGTARWMTAVTRIPGSVLGPLIVVFSVIGTYALRNNLFDVAMTVVFGVAGYFMERWRYPGAPLVIALILGPILETNFRRSMQISGWDASTFFTRPLSLAILSLILLAVLYPVWRNRANRVRSQRASAEDVGGR